MLKFRILPFVFWAKGCNELVSICPAQTGVLGVNRDQILGCGAVQGGSPALCRVRGWWG